MNWKHGLLNSVLGSLLPLTSAAAIAATGPSLLEMSEQMDRIDKQDFQAALNKANACTSARNFPCAEMEIAKAAKAAISGQDKKTLQASRQSLATERLQLANEIRQAEEARQAQIRREEDERRAQVRRQEEARQAQIRREEEEQQAQVRREEEQERREQLARENDDRQSTSDYYKAIGAQIRQRGAENAALLNRVDRQTNAALDQSNRVRAAQVAERDRDRAAREERAADAARDRVAKAEQTARAKAAQPAPESQNYPPRAATLSKADLQTNSQPTPAATFAANTGREQPSGTATQARADSVRSNSASDLGRAVHEVEEDWSPYKGWAIIVRGEHLASREASCSDGKAKLARKLSRDKAAEGLVNQSPCVCTKWWQDDRTVPGMWQCAILGQYSGKGDGGSVEK